MSKVALIGLDGADPDLIRRWRSYLPNLSLLIEKGSFGKLRSSIPPLTVPAWNCIYTGKNPAKLGVYDFLYREKGSYRVRILNSSMLQAPTVWETLSRAKRRVAVLNVPLTYPPKPVNGTIVSGLPLPLVGGKPTTTYTYPPEFSAELDEHVGGYTFPVPVDIPEDMILREVTWKGGAIRRETTMPSEGAEKKLIDAAKYMLAKEEWDFYTVILRELDLASHFYWKYFDKNHPQYQSKSTWAASNPLLDAYVRMDETVGEIVSMLDQNTTVFILSDHGNGPLYRRFYVNEFLRRLRLLSLRRRTLWRMKAGSSFKSTALRMMRLLNRIGGAGFVKRVPKTVGKAVRLVDQFEGNVERIDWGRTKAYSFGEVGRIFLNVKGREPQGTVEPGQEYEHVRDFIIQKLQELRHSSADPSSTTAIYKREDIYSGPFLDSAPDIVFIMDNYECTSSSQLVSSRLFGQDLRNSGFHRPDGILMAAGPDIKPGHVVNANVCDITPTILHLMGLALPEDLDGQPLLSMFRPGSDVVKRAVQYESPSQLSAEQLAWSEEEQRKVGEQLRRMGYLG